VACAIGTDRYRAAMSTKIQHHPAPDRLLPLAAVLERVPISRSRIYEMIAEGSFPAPAKIGKRSLWSQARLDAWIAAQVERAEKPTGGAAA
jgi:prophage regulatory protein